MKVKLVRDNILPFEGETSLNVREPALLALLLMAKFQEELHEISESNFEDPSEYGDCLQLLMDLCELHGVDWPTVLFSTREKKKRVGGFLEGKVVSLRSNKG